MGWLQTGQAKQWRRSAPAPPSTTGVGVSSMKKTYHAAELRAQELYQRRQQQLAPPEPQTSSLTSHELLLELNSVGWSQISPIDSVTSEGSEGGAHVETVDDITRRLENMMMRATAAKQVNQVMPPQEQRLSLPLLYQPGLSSSPRISLAPSIHSINLTQPTSPSSRISGSPGSLLIGNYPLVAAAPMPITGRLSRPSPGSSPLAQRYSGPPPAHSAFWNSGASHTQSSPTASKSSFFGSNVV